VNFKRAVRKYAKSIVKSMGWAHESAKKQVKQGEVREVLNWIDVLENDNDKNHTFTLVNTSKLLNEDMDYILSSEKEENISNDKRWAFRLDCIFNEEHLAEWQSDTMDDEHYSEFIARLTMNHRFKTATWVHGGKSTSLIKKLEDALDDVYEDGLTWGEWLKACKGLEIINIVNKNDLYSQNGHKNSIQYIYSITNKENIMTEEEKKELFPYVIWFNLIIGIYNLYLYTVNDWWFNILVGSLNIGVWVFNRKVIFK
jgi:hypothetical protein